MGQNSNNVRAISDSNYNVWTAPYGTALPSTLPPGTPTGFYGVGLLSDNGFNEGYNVSNNPIYDLAGAIQRQLRNQESRTWTFEALERNAVVLGLQYPGTSVTTTGATAEVQTVTISGTPTGGTFTLSLAGYGSYSAAYNVPTATLATALSSAFGVTVGVTGTAGTSYVCTFPTTSGNVPQMTADGSTLTGGSSPNASVATTTPGVNGVNKRLVGSATQLNRRAFVLDLTDSGVVRRVAVPNGEAVMAGTIAWTSSGAAIAQFTLTAYKDASISNNYWVDLDNDPAQALTYS